MRTMSPNVKAAMREWDANAALDLPHWALERASEISHALVPKLPGNEGSNMLYALPAGLKVRLVAEIAQALVEERENAVYQAHLRRLALWAGESAERISMGCELKREGDSWVLLVGQPLGPAFQWVAAPESAGGAEDLAAILTYVLSY